MTIFFSDWMSLARIIIISIGGYLGLVAILRVSGPRTLSKMNSFDFVITIALGSTYAGGILQKKNSLVDILLTFSMLVGLQFVVTLYASKNPKFNKLIKADPVLLFANQSYLEDKMRHAHVTKDEIDSAIRQQGLSDIANVKYVVLETNGEIVAIPK
ncbi:MAG: DUF421 domain-containing protein [Bacteriovoracaceae bacterium]|nr:DUF421 domain-containing protein [Bacteriovoracaceae bacterium]